MDARARVFRLAMLSISIVLSNSLHSWAQTQNDAALSSQRAAAEKFLQLLLNRPQPGTALDKTIEYYQSVGELDALCERIKTQAKELQVNQPEAAARHWLALALMAQSQSRWSESLELLRQAPDVVQHRWAIGQTQSVAWEQLQRWPEAITVLQPLIQQVLEDPGQTSAESVIECARRLAKAYSRTGQSSRAIEVWKKLESRFGRDVQIATRLASMAADEGELDFAVEVLDRVLAGKLPATKRMELAIQRTSLMARAGHEQAAIDSYQQLLSELNADSWLATDIAGRIEDLIVGRDGVDALLVYYRKQLEQRPDDMQLRLRLAIKLDSEKQWDESDRLFQQLIQRTTTAIEPRLAYAQSLIHQERWHDAANEFAKLAQQQPRNDDIVTQWCEAISADESLDTSERQAQIGTILEKRLEGSPATASAYQQLATQLQRFGLAERAAGWLAKARILQPNDLSILADYSRALLDQGREPEILPAISEFEKANSSDREQLTQVTDLYADLGFGDLAIECLTRACQLSATTTMRYRLAELLEKSQRQSEAAEQLQLAWKELSLQTSAAHEQEALCEEITRRQILLAIHTGKIKELLEKTPTESTSGAALPALAGVDADAVVAWRTAKLLMADGQGKLADETLAPALKRHPNSTMLWRLRAELDESAKRLPESVEAHRKLAELDVRRRSDHLLQVAKGLAQLGQAEAALKQIEAIVTETASSQHVIEVFNLALEMKAEKFARNLLERRLQSRPGDIDVLQRLISYHLDNNAYQQAVDYQWQNLQLMRTPEQRQAAVELLIETHVRLHTLNQLEQQLEKYWRQHDLWREFGIWQAMIALRGENYLKAEKLLARLAESQTTRRFAIESLLRLAEQQGHSLKRFEFMKKLAALDSQAISADAVAEVLTSVPAEHRSAALVKDALELVRGTSKRLGLIQDLIQLGNRDMALRIIDALPETERQSWPIVARTALLWSTLSIDSDTAGLAHVESAARQLQSFAKQPLDLPESLAGQRMLEELLDSQEFITELLATATVFRAYKSATFSINVAATNARSALQTYQALVAAQLQVATTPAARRDVLAEHRRLAMQQANSRERAARLAALALVSHWHSKVPDISDVPTNVQPRSRLTPTPSVDAASAVLAKLKKSLAANLPPTDATIVSRLATFGPGFQYITVDFEKLASQGDPLASLLCLWILESSQRERLKPGDASILKSTAANCSHLGEYAAFAPAQIIAMMAVLQTQDQSNPNGEYLAILSHLAIGKDELQRVVAMLLEKKQTAFVQSLIASQVGKSPCLELLGELATSRAAQASFDPADLW